MTSASCYLFRNLSQDRIAAIEAIARVQTCPAGQWLIHQDDHADNLYMVETGAVELVMPVSSEIEVPVALIRPGNGCVGVSALLDPHVYSLSARCKEDSRLKAIPTDKLLGLFQSDPEFGCTVMANLAQRLLERLCETRQEIKIHFLNLIQSATF